MSKYMLDLAAYPVGMNAATDGLENFVQNFGRPPPNQNELYTGNMHNNRSYAVSCVNNPVGGRHTSKALRLEIRTQNDLAYPSLDRPRAEIKVGRCIEAFRQEHWYAVSIMIPTSWSGHNGSFFGITDWHHVSNSAGTGPLYIALTGSSNPTAIFYHRSEDATSQETLGSTPMTKGAYADFVFRFIWDARSLAAGGTGRITVWKNGTQLFDVFRRVGLTVDENNAPPGEGNAGWPFFKVGPQISPTTSSGYPFVFYVDWVAFGNSFESLTSMSRTFASTTIPLPFKVVCGSLRWVTIPSWNGDLFYSQSDPISKTISTTNAVANTTDDKAFQYARTASGTTPVTYDMPCDNGNYLCTLGFNDWLSTAPSQRVFNVTLNGGTAETGLDVYAQAGGANRALEKTYATTVSNGRFVIQLTGSGDKFLNNYSIVAAGGAPEVLAPLGFNLSEQTYTTEQDLQFTGKGAIVGGGTDPNVKVWYELDGSPVVIGTSPEWVSGSIHLTDGTYNINVLQSDPEGINTTSALSSIVITIDTASSPPVSELQIECGQISGSPPVGWVLDAHYSGSNPAAYTTPTGIAGVPIGLQESSFQSIRYSAGTGAALKYIVPIENGDVEVMLLLCEVSPTQNYKYRVKLQGEGTAGSWTRLDTETSFTDLDPLTFVGRFAALVVTRQITVVDGTLTLEWEGISGTAGLSVAGIQIFRAAAPPPPIPSKYLLGVW